MRAPKHIRHKYACLARASGLEQDSVGFAGNGLKSLCSNLRSPIESSRLKLVSGVVWPFRRSQEQNQPSEQAVHLNLQDMEVYATLLEAKGSSLPFSGRWYVCLTPAAFQDASGLKEFWEISGHAYMCTIVLKLRFWGRGSRKMRRNHVMTPRTGSFQYVPLYLVEDFGSNKTTAPAAW